MSSNIDRALRVSRRSKAGGGAAGGPPNEFGIHTRYAQRNGLLDNPSANRAVSIARASARGGRTGFQDGGVSMSDANQQPQNNTATANSYLPAMTQAMGANTSDYAALRGGRCDKSISGRGSAASPTRTAQWRCSTTAATWHYRASAITAPTSRHHAGRNARARSGRTAGNESSGI
jgi:hypothetical protein